MECSKSDWKLFRSRIGGWQENYMERLVKEYIQLLNSSEDASDKFWKLEERIKKDRKHPGVILEMRKSDMLYNIVSWRRVWKCSVREIQKAAVQNI